MVSGVSKNCPEVLTEAGDPIIPLGAIRNIVRSKEHPAMDGRRGEMGGAEVAVTVWAEGHRRLQSQFGSGAAGRCNY